MFGKSRAAEEAGEDGDDSADSSAPSAKVPRVRSERRCCGCNRRFDRCGGLRLIEVELLASEARALLLLDERGSDDADFDDASDAASSADDEERSDGGSAPPPLFLCNDRCRLAVYRLNFQNLVLSVLVSASKSTSLLFILHPPKSHSVCVLAKPTLYSGSTEIALGARKCGAKYRRIFRFRALVRLAGRCVRPPGFVIRMAPLCTQLKPTCALHTSVMFFFAFDDLARDTTPNGVFLQFLRTIALTTSTPCTSISPPHRISPGNTKRPL